MGMFKRTSLSVLILLMAILFSASLRPAVAQDTSPYVCRDSHYETIRFEFRNLPVLPDGVNWMYLADGGTFDNNVFVADALLAYPDNPDGITAGMVVLGTTDYSFELRGDSAAPLCDSAPALTDPAAVTANVCISTAINAATGSRYCYTPQAGGLVPLPPSAG